MKLTPRDITRVALFASLITIASLILKFGGDVLVPFSMLPFMVMLTGALLGSRLGSLSVLVYVLLGLAGVPVFAKAPYGGIAYLLQPTAGFLAGYVLEAYIVGKLIEKKERPGLSAFILAMAAGIVFLYLRAYPTCTLLSNSIWAGLLLFGRP